MNSLSKISDRTIKILLYIIFAVGTIVCTMSLTLPGVLDEIGTVSNTAILAGDSWLKCVQSMGGFYYKYGQSLLYYPLYLAFRNQPFTLYPVLLSFQMLIISFTPVIAYHIARTYLKIESKLSALLISLGGTGISSIWLYSQYTRGDLILIVLPWILTLVFLKLSTLDKENNKKQRNLYSVLLAFLSVYAYMSHSRGIVLLIATVITVFFISIFIKTHIVNYLYYIPATGIFLIIDKILTHYFKAANFGPYKPHHGGFASFNFDRFMKITTQGGIVVYIKLAIGWIFNLCTSTMGLAIIGFLAVLFITLRIIFKKSNETLQEKIMAFFVLMVMLGVFFMGTLFFFPNVYNMLMGIYVDRADRVVFGRYMVSAVGPMCFIALYYLILKKNTIIQWKSKLFSLIAFAVIIGAFAKLVGPFLNHIPRTTARYFISLTALMGLNHGDTTMEFDHLDKSLVQISLISIGIFALLLVLSQFKNKKILLSVAILTFVISLVNYSVIFVNVRKGRDNYLYNTLHSVIETIHEINQKSGVSETYKGIYVTNEKYVTAYHFDKNGNPAKRTAMNAKHYQLALPMFDLSKLEYIMDEKQTEFFVIAKKGTEMEAIAYLERTMKDYNSHYYKIADFDYENAVRDVVFVRGDNLAKQIEKAGYHLTPFDVSE